MTRTSRVSHEAVIVHLHSAVLFLDVLEAAERFAVSAIPRPTVRGVQPQRKDRPPRRSHWFNSKGKRS